MEKDILNYIIKFYNNFKDLDSSMVHCNCIIENNYKHISYLQNLRKKTMNNYNYKSSDLEETYVKKFLYNELKTINTNDSIELIFRFKKISREMEFYLLEMNCFTRVDKTFSKIKQKLLKKVEDKVDLNTICSLNDKERININFENNLIKINVNKNKNEAGKYFIYHFIIIEKTGTGNKIFNISEPFSTISSKQFLRRKKESFIGRKYNKKEKDLTLYLNGIFKEKSTEFRDYITFELNFSKEKNKQYEINESIFGLN